MGRVSSKSPIYASTDGDQNLLNFIRISSPSSPALIPLLLTPKEPFPISPRNPPPEDSVPSITAPSSEKQLQQRCA
jgi:hypothetical protein